MHPGFIQHQSVVFMTNTSWNGIDNVYQMVFFFSLSSFCFCKKHPPFIEIQKTNPYIFWISIDVNIFLPGSPAVQRATLFGSFLRRHLLTGVAIGMSCDCGYLDMHPHCSELITYPHNPPYRLACGAGYSSVISVRELAAAARCNWEVRTAGQVYLKVVGYE